MDGRETIYYPQDEMNQMLIPVTSGCPYNRCAFCSMYKGVPYRQIPLSEVEKQIIYGDLYTERIFLTGADPLAIGFDAMQHVLALVRKHLPYCACVASYASVRSLAAYSTEELSALHDAGLRLLYIGFESGLDRVLESVDKGHRVETAVEQAKKLNQARLQFNTILIYGIAGLGSGIENAVASAAMVNQFETRKVITMNLKVFNGTILEQRVHRGEFFPADGAERLAEIRTLLEYLDPARPLEFDTTHPTNMIKIRGTLPQDKDRLIREVQQHAQQMS
ncbi:MAG: radical SAM protein [Eubacteriales bacterium]|nr:radical SAM protein [Eubacteriales bacterium]